MQIARKVKLDGHTFDSRHEARVYADHKIRERLGEIAHLRVHFKVMLLGFGGEPILIRSERYPNGRKAVYTCDLDFQENGKWIVVDVKSPASRTADYKLRRGILEAMFPEMEFREID